MEGTGAWNGFVSFTTGLEDTENVNAEMAGTVPAWEWIGAEGAPPSAIELWS